MLKIKHKNLTKKDISTKISSSIGFSKAYSIGVVDNFIEILMRSIKKKERIGRNPKNKESFIIDARNSISFIMSKTLKNLINS